MWEDPIVAEVRRVRAELEAEANGDLHEMFRRAVAFQKKYETERNEAVTRAVEIQSEYASESDAAADRPTRGAKVAEALEKLAAINALSDIADPSEWRS